MSFKLEQVGVAEAFEMPHYKTHRDGRNFVTWPMRGAADTTTAADSKFDVYLYRLGNDAYARTVLTGLAGGATYDGILVVMLRVRVRFAVTGGGTAWDDARKTKVATAFAAKSSQLNYARTASFDIATGGNKPPKFDRCLLYFSTRYMDADDGSFDSLDGARAQLKVEVTIGAPFASTHTANEGRLAVTVPNLAPGTMTQLGDAFFAAYLARIGLTDAGARPWGTAASYDAMVRKVMDTGVAAPTIA
jgi:hypothetical protein